MHIPSVIRILPLLLLPMHTPAETSVLPWSPTGSERSELGQVMREGRSLAKYDIHPEARSIPGLGHNYLGDLQKEKIDWLKPHVRQRPDAFEFVTDDNLTNSCWGITLSVGYGGIAKVSYRREGQTLHITTQLQQNALPKI